MSVKDVSAEHAATRDDSRSRKELQVERAVNGKVSTNT